MAGNRVNISKFVYAPLIKDAIDSVEYGPIKEILGIMQIGITPKIAGGDLYGNGVITDAEQAQTGYEITIEFNKIPIEDRAVWLGNTRDTEGVIHEGAKDQAIEMAVGFEVELTGTHRELVWFPKVGASPIANNMQQRTDSTNFSTDNLTLKAKYRIADRKIKFFGDTSNEDGKFTAEMADKFLTKIPVAVAPAAK